MKIAFNPSTVAALTAPPNNKDITFDLRGQNIFARGVKFCGTDTNTWRDIKVNNVSIGSRTLDLRNGSNTTLTNTNGVVTINSTWRPVVDNLTSDSTTSSLSAKQGKVLKALIDGKSDSGHNHDGRYVRYYAVTTLDCNNLAVGLTAASVNATNAGAAYHSAYLYISDVGTPFQIQIPDSNVPYIYKRYYSSGKWSGWFKLNAGYADSAGSVAWANITGKPSSYTPSAHTHSWNSLTHSSTTENQAILTNGKANGWKLYTLNISGWNNAANNAHSHANKSVLDGITSGLINNWNTAYNFVSNITGTDTDKVINKWEEIVNFLAGITEDNKLNTLLNSKLSIQQLSAKDILTTKTNNALFWVDTKGNASTITTGPFTDHPYALLSVTNYNQNAENHKFFYRSRLAFSSAGDIKVASCHHEYEYQQDETWYNVLTSKNSGISGSTIKLNGTSITVYSSGTADGRYVKKSGDTMSGVLTIDTTNFGALTIKRNDDANGASIQFRGKSSVYGYIGLNNSTKDKQFLRWSSDTSRVYTILDTSSTYISNGKGVINGTTITQVDNATNSTNSTNARKLVNWYSARPTSLNAQFGDGSLRIFYATSSTTEGKPAEDSHILHLAWDNTGGYDAQLAVHTRSGKVSTRAQNGGTWQPWKTLAFTTDIPSSLKNPYSFNVFGVVYDGSVAKTVTTSNFISQIGEATATITDGTMLITSYASNSGFADTNAVNVPYKRKAVHLWEYIKAKTDSLYATKGHNHDDRYLRLTGGWMSGDINFGGDNSYDIGSDAAASRYIYTHWLGARSGRKLELGANNSGFGQGLCIDTNLNVGIGTNTPAYKLDVKGDIYSSGYVRASSGFIKGSSSDSYVLLGGGGHKLESSLNVAYSKYLTGITLTGGDGNNAGYRLIFEKTMGGWTINYGVWAIALRHSGRGTLNIGFDTTNSDGSTYIYNIRFLGSTASRESTPFRAFYNSTTKVFRIYWHYYDYTSGDIAVLRGNMEPHNGTWMASLPNDVGTELAITCNMADQAANADTVDGYHANGLLTALSNSNNGISITVGGTTKSVSNISVNYASSAGNANTLDGYPANGSNVAPYGHIPTIESDGVMEVGKYIDFHNDNNGKHDFSTRLQSTGNYGNEVNLPSASGTLALTSDILNYYWANVKISTSSSTTTSPTVHTLAATRVCAGHNPGIDNSISCSNWFRSSGNTGWYNTTYQGGWYMSDTSWIRAHNGVGIYTSGQIYSSSSIRMSNILLEHTDEINNSANGGIHLNYRNSGNVSLCQGGGSVGIGTTTPSYKLDVNGQIRASGFHHSSVNSDNYMLLAGGGYSLLKTLIFTDKAFTYTDNNHYTLRFHKLSSLCNNLVWVDGYVSGPVSTLFTIADEVRPYCYKNDYSIVTIYNNYIRVDAYGHVAIDIGDATHRIGFFYTGRA